MVLQKSTWSHSIKKPHPPRWCKIWLNPDFGVRNCYFPFSSSLRAKGGDLILQGLGLQEREKHSVQNEAFFSLKNRWFKTDWVVGRLKLNMMIKIANILIFSRNVA